MATFAPLVTYIPPPVVNPIVDCASVGLPYAPPGTVCYASQTAPAQATDNVWRTVTVNSGQESPSGLKVPYSTNPDAPNTRHNPPTAIEAAQIAKCKPAWAQNIDGVGTFYGPLECQKIDFTTPRAFRNFFHSGSISRSGIHKLYNPAKDEVLVTSNDPSATAAVLNAGVQVVEALPALARAGACAYAKTQGYPQAAIDAACGGSGAPVTQAPSVIGRYGLPLAIGGGVILLALVLGGKKRRG